MVSLYVQRKKNSFWKRNCQRMKYFTMLGLKPLKISQKIQKKGEFKIIFLSILLYNIMEVVL